MLVSTRAIVLTKQRFKDNDLIVHCFTEDFGRKSYILKGILKSKRAKLKPAFFQPLTMLHIEANHKTSRSLQYIREARIDKNTSTLHSDIIKGSIVMFLAEVLSMILKEDDAHKDLYRFTETAIIWLDSNELMSSFHLKFMVEITKYLGFYPDLDPQSDYFDLLEGRSQDVDTGVYSISGENLSLLKQVLGTKFDVTNTIQMSVGQKRSFLDMILLYFRLHLDGFKEPKSLTVLNEVFTNP